MDLATYKYYKKLEEWENIIRHVCLSREDATELGNEIYRFFKAIQPKYLKNGKFIRQYEVLFDKLLDIERLLRGYRIIDYEIKSNDTQEIDSIIEAVREGILKEHLGFNKETFTMIDLANSCLRVSKAFTKVALKQGLKCRMVKIYPGYKEKSYLYDGNGYHCFNIVEENNKKYIVDLTYSQFFYLSNNILNKLGLMYGPNCHPGVFMLMDKDRLKLSKDILEQGYVLLDDKNLKNYLDGFTISYRNGLYYEAMNDFSYTTKYTAEDYRKFLRHEDNQVNHEWHQVLGYQEKLLLNPRMKF